MTVFWSLAAGMIVLALLFTVPPLLRPVKKSSVSRDALNAEVIRTQLAELKADVQSGKLDAAQYDSARADLERELLYDITSPAGQSDSFTHRSGRWAVLVLILAIPLGAVLLYQSIGSVELVDLRQTAAAPSQAPPTGTADAPHSMEELVVKLAERLKSEPDNAQGWVLLARSYSSLKRFGDAADAYERAYKLGGSSHPALLTDYADALVMSNNGQFSEKSASLLEKTLELDPDNAKGLWLTGHWKYANGEYAEAIDYWQKTAAQLPANSEDIATIHQQINLAQNKLGIETTPVAPVIVAAETVPDNNQAAAAKVSLTVEVRLDPKLSDKVSPDDTLFVYARAVKGPRMPLAIVRKKAKELPVTVTLDDSMAMSPAMVLSNFSEITVEARISRSGNAMTQSGDLKGMLSPVKTHSAGPVNITIDSVVP